MQLHYTLFPSRYLAVLLCVAHGAALAAVIALPLAVAMQLALAALLLGNLVYQLRRSVWLSAPSAVLAFRFEGDQVLLDTRDGVQLSGTLLGSSLATPLLTILNVLPQGTRLARSVLLLPDSMGAESLRQLRVYLRWQAGR